MSLTKPGIIFGNLITVSGGFFLASHVHVNVWLYVATLLGISFIMAAGCVFNNIYDADIDALMERTKRRVLPQGLVSSRVALLFGSVLALFGTLILYYFTNLLTLVIALIGLLCYVGVYTLWFKRHSIFGTLVGSVAGAVPPVVGYCAVTNRFDIAAIILLAVLCLWQMPHSYAIAIYRRQDYIAASIPVLPVKKSMLYTKCLMLIYVVAFTVVASMLTMYGYAGWLYFVSVLIMGTLWALLSLKGFWTTDPMRWARKMFGFSILVITILSITMAVNV